MRLYIETVLKVGTFTWELLSLEKPAFIWDLGIIALMSGSPLYVLPLKRGPTVYVFFGQLMLWLLISKAENKHLDSTLSLSWKIGVRIEKTRQYTRLSQSRAVGQGQY